MAKAKGKNATAFHGTTTEGVEVVGIGNLRVVIVPDGNAWFAQGLEIDYAAQGDTIEDAKEQFHTGLTATVHEHLKVFGNIEKILTVAPQETWKELLLDTSVRRFRLTQVTTHLIEGEPIRDLGVHDIQFIVPLTSAEPCAAIASM